MSHATVACGVSVTKPGKGRTPAVPLSPASVPDGQLIRIQIPLVSQRHDLISLYWFCLNNTSFLSSVSSFFYRFVCQQRTCWNDLRNVFYKWPNVFKSSFHCKNLSWKKIKLCWPEEPSLFICMYLQFYSLLVISASYIPSVSHVAIFFPAGGWTRASLKAPWWRTLPAFSSPRTPHLSVSDYVRRHRDRQGQGATGNQIRGRQEAVCPGPGAAHVEHRRIYAINRWAGTHRCMFRSLISLYRLRRRRRLT